jgi:hypothetical protein
MNRDCWPSLSRRPGAHTPPGWRPRVVDLHGERRLHLLLPAASGTLEPLHHPEAARMARALRARHRGPLRRAGLRLLRARELRLLLSRLRRVLAALRRGPGHDLRAGLSPRPRVAQGRREPADVPGGPTASRRPHLRTAAKNRGCCSGTSDYGKSAVRGEGPVRRYSGARRPPRPSASRGCSGPRDRGPPHGGERPTRAGRSPRGPSSCPWRSPPGASRATCWSPTSGWARSSCGSRTGAGRSACPTSFTTSRAGACRWPSTWSAWRSRPPCPPRSCSDRPPPAPRCRRPGSATCCPGAPRRAGGGGGGAEACVLA